MGENTCISYLFTMSGYPYRLETWVIFLLCMIVYYISKNLTIMAASWLKIWRQLWPVWRVIFDHYGGKLTKNMAATLTIMAATWQKIWRQLWPLWRVFFDHYGGYSLTIKDASRRPPPAGQTSVLLLTAFGLLRLIPTQM